MYLNSIFDTQTDTRNRYVSMTTRFTLRTDVKRRDGLLPIYLKITGDNKPLNLKLYVKAENWDEKEQRVKPINRSHEDLNLVLDATEAKITEIKIKYRLRHQPLTPRILKEELLEGNHRVYFTSYMRNKIKENKQLGADTARRYTSVANNLDKYKEDILFSEMTEVFINKYRNYMLGKGNAKTTVNGNIKLIKQYLKLAQKDGIHLQLDLDDIKGGSTNGNRSYLTPAEVRTLCRYYFDKKVHGTKQLTLGYFLFACMTGLRVSQVLDLDRNHLLSMDFAFINFKNKKDQTIALNKMARKIVEFNPDLFVKKIHENTMNKDLKRLAKNNKIYKDVTFHVSRHTFATNFLRMDGKIQHLQVLLGHSKIDTTMIYVHILAEEANAEIHKLDDLFQDFGFDLDLKEVI